VFPDSPSATFEFAARLLLLLFNSIGFLPRIARRLVMGKWLKRRLKRRKRNAEERKENDRRVKETRETGVAECVL
jgi:hypothetical protein